MFKTGDIVFLRGGNPNNLGIIREVGVRNGKGWLTIDKGWKVIHSYDMNNRGIPCVILSEKTGVTIQDLINNHYEFKFNRAIKNEKFGQAHYYKSNISRGQK